MMKKIKDFVYDKNDLLIALLVLTIAAFLILWRMDVIMAYPAQVFGDSSNSNVTTPKGDTSQDGDQKDPSTSSPEGDEPQGDGSSDALWVGGALTKDVEVVVTGNTASAAISCLVDAGLFGDYEEYQQICEDTGLHHEKVSAGAITFEKGSTKADVARKINWS